MDIKPFLVWNLTEINGILDEGAFQHIEIASTRMFRLLNKGNANTQTPSVGIREL